MDIIRRLIALVSRAEEYSSANLNVVPVYYLGHTYTAQPTPDELKRASMILSSKNKKNIEKNLLPIMSINFEENDIILRNQEEFTCCSFEIKRIVLSCVDAKNQRLLAIFYHNDGPYIATSITVRGLECHLFLCRTKEIARQAATKIGTLLDKKYNSQRPSNSLARQKHNIQTICENQVYYDTQPQEAILRRRPSLQQENNEQRINVRNNRIRYSKTMDDDIEYEDIYKFFRKNVLLNISQSNSFYSTRSDSLTTFLTTTGYDSGRASTSPSIDIKHDELVSNRLDVSIPEMMDENGFPLGMNNNNNNDGDEGKNRNTLTLDDANFSSNINNNKESGQIGFITTVDVNTNTPLVASSFDGMDCTFEEGELDKLLEMVETNI